jgi:small subunit ribosomal protein S20
LANHKSAVKRAKQNKIRRMRNMTYKTRVKRAVKEVRTASAEKSSQEQLGESFINAVSIIQKSASKGVIHKRKASRQISRLARLVNQQKEQPSL